MVKAFVTTKKINSTFPLKYRRFWTIKAYHHVQIFYTSTNSTRNTQIISNLTKYIMIIFGYYCELKKV